MTNRPQKRKLDRVLIDELTCSGDSSEDEFKTMNQCDDLTESDGFSKDEIGSRRLSDAESGDDSVEDPTYNAPNDSGSPEDAESGAARAADTSKGTRWRRSNPDMWKSNKRKRLYRRGEKHINTAGKEVQKKSPKSVVGHKCRQNCNEKISQQERESICQVYWALEDYNRKKDFILGSVKTFEPKQRRTASSKQRKASHAYFFVSNGKEIRVCKNFFLSTLCVSNNTVLGAFAGRSEHNSFISKDMRGRHEPKHKLSRERYQFIKDHIESFPVIESHYCRADTKMEYLEPGLNIVKMHELYKEKCQLNQLPPVKCQTYRKIFCTEYNIGFHKPRKDQCLQCETFKNAGESEKLELQAKYDEHIKRKQDAQAQKKEDKEKAARDPSFVTATFDLQSVLQIPSSDVSQMYYKRKICVYNFTIYEAISGIGHCYLWSELDGKRGSSEIGSCINHYLSSLPDSVKSISFYSDSCGGQNRNQYVASLLMHSVQSLPLEEVTLNFLEPGHTQMECDSMHAAIEHSKKNVSVYTLGEWCNIIRLARRHKPYIIHQLNFSSFYDLEKLKNQVMVNRNKNSSGETVNWLKIHSLKFCKDQPLSFLYSYDPIGDYQRVITKVERGRQAKPATLVQLYTKQLGISAAKKKDLVHLCQTGAIPMEVQHWYMNLPVRKELPAEKYDD